MLVTLEGRNGSSEREEVPVPTIGLDGFEATALFHLAKNPSIENLKATLKGLSSDAAREIARAIVDPQHGCDPAVRETAQSIIRTCRQQ